MMPSRNMDPGDGATGEDDVPQAMAFTVTFDSAKSTNNKFIKRHIRNLSLPITKIYDNKTTDNAINGKMGKRPGNHSEGYFSSDPDEEHPNSKLSNDIKISSKPGGRMTPEGAAVDSRASMERDVEEEDEEEEDEEDDGAGSEAASETGTYTIEKESPEVVAARLSLDTNFGVEQGTSVYKTSRDSTTWIKEWATQVTNHKNQSQSVTETHSKSTVSRTQQVGPTKIPSPLTTRARFGTKNTGRAKEITETNVTVRPTLTQRNKTEDCSDSETERLLKTTEKVMSAIAARLSLDSGGESETENRRSEMRRGNDASPRVNETKSNTTTTTTTTTTTRYNRAFSLRRGRLSDSGSGKSPSGGSPPPPVGRGIGGGICSGGGSTNTNTNTNANTRRVETLKPPPFTSVRPKQTPQANSALSRTDTGRFSMRGSKVSPQSPSLSGTGNSRGKKPSGGGRSNSTLSSKEVEFQNWKRRKSYDPMKAAAEGRKKEAAKRPPTTTTTTPKSPMNSVWRSASFHGTRQLGGGPSSSDDEEEEATLSVEEDDWPVPQGPKTSLQNSPRGSKGSLYSNSSNNSPHARQNLEGVDILLVSALYRLANKQKGTASCILKKLRCLYDEESHKYKLITSALEQLEQSEPPASGSPHMSPSRELASTLTVSKRLNSTFKILNEVLFDEVDFE